ESLAQQLFDFHNMTGATLSPIDSYLLLRGLKTLHLRIERAQSNARKLAKKCQSLQAIDEVLYSGQTGMLSLRLNKAYSVAKLLENLDI
ncbi:PLP-dependent transferase, partial [Staphylococcus aureus]|nr:PLP-dependent transferase [Staphylococcus aureus]